MLRCSANVSPRPAVLPEVELVQPGQLCRVAVLSARNDPADGLVLLLRGGVYEDDIAEQLMLLPTFRKPHGTVNVRRP